MIRHFPDSLRDVPPSTKGGASEMHQRIWRIDHLLNNPTVFLLLLKMLGEIVANASSITILNLFNTD